MHLVHPIVRTSCWCLCLAAGLFTTLGQAVEQESPILVASESGEMRLEIRQTAGPAQLTIEGIGPVDRGAGNLTFFSEEKNRGELLKYGWRFESMHGKKPFDWRLFVLDEHQLLVVGIATGEAELVCEFVSIADSEVQGRTVYLGPSEFFQINTKSLGFVAATDVSIQRQGERQSLVVETTRGDHGQFLIDFESGALIPVETDGATLNIN